MARSSRWVLVICLALLAGRANAQVSFSSSNTLHFGWGTTNPNSPSWNPALAIHKTDSILAVLAMGAVALPTGVLMLQEVMPIANLGFFHSPLVPRQCPVATCSVIQSNSLGRGWYRETYVYIVNDPQGVLGLQPLEECQGANCANFMRPPVRLELTHANRPNSLSLVNFHAIWGQNQGQRLAEATAMAAFLQPLANHAFLVGGDWNLDAPTVAGQLNVAAVCITPVGLTTLNAAGVPSSSYDHFYLSENKNCVQNLNAQIFPPAGLYQNWRAVVSDHLGIGFVLP